MELVKETEITATESQDSQIIQLSEIQVNAYNEAAKKLNDFTAEMETKKYYVELTASDIDVLQGFIKNDAKWKFTESLGIGEITKQLETSVDKSGKILISAVAIEAIYYYLSKVEGKGQTVDSSSIGNVETYLKLLKGINLARTGINADNEEKKRLEYVVACRAEGLDPDASEEKK